MSGNVVTGREPYVAVLHEGNARALMMVKSSLERLDTGVSTRTGLRLIARVSAAKPPKIVASGRKPRGQGDLCALDRGTPVE
jgi:hypothetical protein